MGLKWACLRNFVIESAGAPSTNNLYKYLRNERVTKILDKERCIKEQYFSINFMLVAFMSPGKFSNTVFPV